MIEDLESSECIEECIRQFQFLYKDGSAKRSLAHWVVCHYFVTWKRKMTTHAILQNVIGTLIWRSGTSQPLISGDCPQVWLDYTDPTQVMEHLENSSLGFARSGTHVFVKLCVCVCGLRLLASLNHFLAYLRGNSVPRAR